METLVRFTDTTGAELYQARLTHPPHTGDMIQLPGGHAGPVIHIHHTITGSVLDGHLIDITIGSVQNRITPPDQTPQIAITPPD